MTNYDALKQMPLKNFADMAFFVARNEVNTLEEFIGFLEREVPEALEDTLKGALQNMQHPNKD